MFDDRVVAFDESAAGPFAEETARARRPRRSVSLAEAPIAETALSRGFDVASRDTTPFEALGVRVIDPLGRLTLPRARRLVAVGPGAASWWSATLSRS